MKRDEILAALQDSRAQMEATLAGLTAAQMIDPGVVGDWSVKDLLSHLTAWEAELVTALAKAKRGQTPKLSGWTDSEVDALNAKWYKENKNRPLERVLAHFRGVRQQTLRQVEALGEEELAEPKPWLKNRRLFEYIKGDTFEHEAEHAAHIREWRRHKLGEEK
ncbi:MAG: ClbS/DfsB family four-helix bundle protein [Chloroflexi bacterium]|nr:ClbS/DfsB family four-helix bundle protein [Chloroflexota bacterium]